MSAGRTSRSWSRTRSTGSDDERSTKRKSKDLRRSLDTGHTPARSVDESLQRFVLIDPIAFRYLEDDASVTVLVHRREISGYQSYIVEQWATSRDNPTFTIITYTGDSSDVITASILGIPRDEGTWSLKLKVYFKALNHFHAKRRNTSDGIIMVTSLPGFPSSLTVIQIPGGDVSKHYPDFLVNEDLKRLGCAGRVGLTLMYPNTATVAKYHQLYRTHERVPLYRSVIELVRMCQIALLMFGLLDKDYTDGLLCDVTEKAIVAWWTNFGSEIYNVEPHDGILGPSTVAGLLGLLLGARNRLYSLGSPVPKDAFDLDQMKRGIAHFQKLQRLPRSRRLDVTTLSKLHALTEKAANTGRWRLPKAVKTTVAEISGKGEALAQEGTSRLAKAGIADVETTDMEAFEQLVSGERCKWLWKGKALKRQDTVNMGEPNPDGQLMTSNTFPQESHEVQTKRHSDQAGGFRASLDGYMSDHRASRRSLEEPKRLARRQSHRESTARKVLGVLDDGRAGIDRLRGAVSVHKRPLESGQDSSLDSSQKQESLLHRARPSLVRSHTSPTSSPSRSVRSQAPDNTERSEAGYARTPPDRAMTTGTETKVASWSQEASQSLNAILSSSATPSITGENVPQTASPMNELVPVSAEYSDVELDDVLPAGQHEDEDLPFLIRRRASGPIPQADAHGDGTRACRTYRSLSFSIAAASMHATVDTELVSTGVHDTESVYIEQRFLAERLKDLQDATLELSTSEAAWTEEQISKLASQLEDANKDHEALHDSFDAPAQSAHVLRDMATAVLRDEQEILNEGKREVETLAAKLDYEIANLKDKVEDVEQGLEDFERAVDEAEQRINQVERDSEKHAGWGCVMS